MSQIQEIELSIEEAKRRVALGDALDRLNNNADFKKIVQVGYFEEEASRAVLAKASPMMRAHQEPLNNLIIGIGELYQYFYKIQIAADQAAGAILDSEEVLEQLAADGEML